MVGAREANVSAVIPTRHRPEMLVAAVRSALAQSDALLEIIVVVDGPDPASIAVLEALEQSELGGRLRVVALEVPVGGAEARNLGVRQARGLWIAFLDDDDLWLPHKLAVQRRRAEASRAPDPVIGSAVLARGPQLDAVWPRSFYQPGEPMSEYLFCRQGWSYGDALLQTSTLFASRALLLRIPFECGLKKHQDWDWLLRASADPGVEILQVQEPLAIFHVEGARPSVGRAPDWRFSLAWAAKRRAFFTPRAYAAFLATECAPQAARAGATLGERARLCADMVRLGSPTLKLCLLCLVFLLVPQPVRRWLRNLGRDLWAVHHVPRPLPPAG